MWVIVVGKGPTTWKLGLLYGEELNSRLSVDLLLRLDRHNLSSFIEWPRGKAELVCAFNAITLVQSRLEKYSCFVFPEIMVF